MPTRRTFLLGGLGVAALAVAGGYAGVEEGILPGRVKLAELTGQCDVDATPPTSNVAVQSGSFASSARKTSVGWSLAIPPNTPVKDLPVVLVLHGRGDDHTTAFKDLKLQDFLAAHTKSGGKPFALASVDGGRDSYWHPRRDGDNPLAMLAEEFLPLLRNRGLNTTRIGALGWSMGGYGALLLARESHRKSVKGLDVAAAAAGSPALFGSYKSSAQGAFDDESDFAKYGDLSHDPDVGDTPLHVSCGRDDAFTDATTRYRGNVTPTPAGGIGKGCHTEGYWRSLASQQLAFLGGHLTA
ncbi:MAG TPA: alpha/beta hydrolase-fold protein [Acidothermaceae bacterium]|nr:alpha/beta hydrolase-fold protein [Acidothermaceae bacterium]